MDLRPSIFLEVLRRAEEHADALASKLELSEKAREKAEEDAAAVESLRQRLQTAENALSEKNSQQIERENAIADRFDTQNQRFTSKLFSFLPAYVFILICLSEC
jgi:flagellar motility protein MotE (MotC chaperone)